MCTTRGWLITVTLNGVDETVGEINQCVWDQVVPHRGGSHDIKESSQEMTSETEDIISQGRKPCNGRGDNVDDGTELGRQLLTGKGPT